MSTNRAGIYEQNKKVLAQADWFRKLSMIETVTILLIPIVMEYSQREP